MKRICVKSIILCSMVLMFMGGISTVSYGMSLLEYDCGFDVVNVAEKADKIEYIYKIDENGIEWKRLYNFTKGEWVDAEWQRA